LNENVNSLEKKLVEISHIELVGETNIQEAYNQLLMKLKNVEIEKESLVVKLHEVDVRC
jgi:hypothetical protein